MGCRLMAKRAPLLNADLTGPWLTALTMTPPCSLSTTNPGTMWRPLCATLKIWKMDSKNVITQLFFIHLPVDAHFKYDKILKESKAWEVLN